MNDKELIVSFCLAAAATGTLRTIYHDRIDGLLIPVLMTPVLRNFGKKIGSKS